ncbi:DUF2079 domain-containing protein [Leptolyngbyaceae cyanobacterium UHCC 1019]
MLQFQRFKEIWAKRYSEIQLEIKPVLGFAAFFFVVMLLLALHRHLTLYASYDQGIFNQLFWNGLHGNFFQSSLSSVLSGAVVIDRQVPTVSYHRLGQHFDPILLLWLPIYAIFPHAATLVVIQVAQVAAAGLVLYALARQYLQPRLAQWITASYYTSVAVIGPTFSNFHDLSQIPLLLFTLFLALEKRWWWLFWLMAGLTLLVREDTGILLFGIGLYLALSRRFPVVGVALCSVGFAYVMTATNIFMPMFSRDISQRFMVERFGHFASGNEASTFEILGGILSNPLRLITHVFSSLDVKVSYMVAQTLSLAFVPLISPSAWIMISAPLAQLLLQGGDSRFSVYIRYAITLVPGLFYGAILWWSVHPQVFRPQFKKIWLGLIMLSLLVVLLKSPHRVFYFAIPDSFQPWVHVPLTRQWSHAAAARSLLAQVPPNASVSATTYLVPPLSGRRAALRMPFLQFRNDQNQVENVEYIVADFWQLQQYQPAFGQERGYMEILPAKIDNLLAQNQYGIQAFQDGIVLMQRSKPSQPEALAQWKAIRPTYLPTPKSN